MQIGSHIFQKANSLQFSGKADKPERPYLVDPSTIPQEYQPLSKAENELKLALYEADLPVNTYVANHEFVTVSGVVPGFDVEGIDSPAKLLVSTDQRYPQLYRKTQIALDKMAQTTRIEGFDNFYKFTSSDGDEFVIYLHKTELL